jgi:hypothetical protein
LDSFSSALLAGLLATVLLGASCSSNSSSSSPQITLVPVLNQVVVSKNVLLNGNLPGNSSAVIDWTVNGIPNGNAMVGTIVGFSGSGPANGVLAQYLAPATIPNPPVVTITISVHGDSADQASVPITVGPAIVISPATVNLPPYTAHQFSVSVSGGLADTSVIWQASCPTVSSACGSISPAGFYQAPNSVPTTTMNGAVIAQSVLITATSQAAPLFSGNAGVSIFPSNQSIQALPVLLGTSGSNINDTCGNGSCGGGTFGSLVQRAGVQYILTNWHVAAPADGGMLGDEFVQPGLEDAACTTAQTKVVGNLSELLDPHVQTGVKVDAAIAQVVDGAVQPGGAIIGLGASIVDGMPSAQAPAAGSGMAAFVGEMVAKSGRSTGVTCATIQSVDTSVNITYLTPCSSTTSSVSFSNQVVVGGTGFLAEGDSGSLLVDQKTAEAVALLFAADADSATGNPVSDVLAALTDSKGNVPAFVGGPEHPVAACSIPEPTAAARRAARLPFAAVQAAIAVKEKNVAGLMSDPAVQGVGVGTAQDNASVAALIVYVLKGSAHAAIPTEIQGIPVRIIETTGFRAGSASNHDHPCAWSHPSFHP